MNNTALRKDWLASNAVIAFMGALLLGQSWQMSEGTVKLLFVFTVQDYTAFVILAIIAGLFVLSMFWALAAVVPVGWLHRWAICSVTGLSSLLGFFVLISFFLGLISAIPDLPLEQWWSWFLIVGGFVLFFVLLYRQFDWAKLVGAASRADSLPIETDSESPPHP